MSSNITALPTARVSDSGHSSSLDSQGTLASLVAHIDKALGDSWSFDVVHHEVSGDETIVFARLIVNGRHRVGIGGTSLKGPLVDRLNAAAHDALTRASEWMGVAAMPVTQPTCVTSPAESMARITRKQLDYALSLARDRGIPRDRLVATCLSDYGKKPEYLTRAEASVLIESLKKEAA
jgi:hypothetical protein